MKITLKDAEVKKAFRARIPSHYNEPDPERHLGIWDSDPSVKSIMSFSKSQREKMTCGLPLFDYVDKSLSTSLKTLECHLTDIVSNA